MTRADDRLQRLMLAFPLMAEEDTITLADLATRVGTTADVLRKDFASLERYDTPGGWVDTVQVMIDGKRASMTSAHFKRPQRLTRPERLALELGLSMLERELPVDEQGAVSDARRKLREVSVRRPQAAGDALRLLDGQRDAEAHAVEVARDGELEALSVLHAALEHAQVVALEYQRADEREASTRDVHPYQLVRVDANIYLVAHCEKAEGLRVFRLDRVLRAAPTSRTFTRPADFRVEDVLTNGRAFQHEAPRDRLVVRYAPRVAGWIAEREGVTCAPDGSLTVTYPLADPSWAVRHVLQYGPEAVVLEPDAVRARVAEVLDQLLSADSTPAPEPA